MIIIKIIKDVVIVMVETENNFLKTILTNFRDRDKKRVARYLYKAVRQLRKELRKNKKEF